MEKLTQTALDIMREKPLVLHVDGERSRLSMAEDALIDAGFSVVQASNGQKAIDLFKQHQPDIIIMSAEMPVMNGFETLAVIRKTALGAHVPILMMTAMDDLDAIVKAYDENATDFIPEPIDYTTLPHRLRYMLRAKAIAEELRLSQERLDSAQRVARMGHWEWNIAESYISWSREVSRIFSFDQHILGGTWEDLIGEFDEEAQIELRLYTKEAALQGDSFSKKYRLTSKRKNEARTVLLKAEPKLNGEGVCTHLYGSVQDVSHTESVKKEIHELAYYDLVTGLPNRAQLTEALAHALHISERLNNKFAVLFLDLDHFKKVNDSHGHDAGDELLQQVSKRLSGILRDSDMVSKPIVLDGSCPEERTSKDTVARIGGDEFVLLLGSINRAEDAARVAERISQAVSKPYTISGVEMLLTTTIGISVYPTDGRDAETLLKHADVAMYHAKENGRNGFQFYSPAIHEKALQRFSMERELKYAIENNQLKLLYQPKIDLATGDVVGVEALARWLHPERGEVLPEEFISLAEESGLIIPLGKWVLNESAHQVQEWISRGVGEFSVAVNCSPVQFTRGNIVSDISDTLAVSGISPHLLEVEFTEKLFLNNINSGIQLLASIKGLGVQIAIDDFGTGVSSLSYLKRLPVDKLKIDDSFVAEMVDDKGDAAIVQSIVTLGHSLGLSIVAEGVETDQQLKMLAQYKCNEVQGYYFSYPLSSVDFELWLSDRAKPHVKVVSG